MYSQWYSSGIKYFEDIYDNAEKSFYTFRSLKEKYALPEGDSLKYSSIIHSVPNSWKTNIKTENVDMPKKPSILEQITKSKQTSKYTYELLMKKKLTPEIKSEQKMDRTIRRRRLKLEQNIYQSLTGNQRHSTPKFSI